LPVDDDTRAPRQRCERLRCRIPPRSVPPQASPFNAVPISRPPSGRWANKPRRPQRGTFVPARIEPTGLSTLPLLQGILPVDSRYGFQGLATRTLGPWFTSNTAPPSPPCPRAAGTPTGRSFFLTTSPSRYAGPALRTAVDSLF